MCIDELEDWRKAQQIDARNGCYGNEEGSVDDGIKLADTIGNSGAAEYRAGEPRSAKAEVIALAPTESGMYSQKGDCPDVGVSALPSDAKGNPRFSTPKYDGNLLPAMTSMVTGFVDKLARRALAANRVIDRIQPCPSGADCLSGQKHERIFACEFCENFKGCSDCVAAHEAEAHWTDSDTAREMHS